MSAARTLRLVWPLLASALLACRAVATEPPAVSPPHASLACAACHLANPPSAAETSCTTGKCHTSQALEAWSSPHDHNHLWTSDVKAPSCAACHGGHQMKDAAGLFDAGGSAGLDRACVSCHPADRYRIEGPGAPAPAGLDASVHGRGTVACAARSLTCFACHRAHTIREASDPASPINRRSIAATCGRCHVKEQAAYAAGAHAIGEDGGPENAPTCVSCHGAHAIERARADGSATAAGQVVYTCSGCHDDPSVIRKAGLPDVAVETYEGSFHGQAYAEGMCDVATCVSCHGAHRVLPSSDVRSSTNPANLPATCGGCHRDVDKRLTAAFEHPRRGFHLGRALGAMRLYFPVAGAAVSPILIVAMGVFVGFLSGLFGVGGGFLMTPLLIFVGIPPAVAAGTDAAQITAGASSGALSHSRLGNVDFKMGLTIVGGGIVGGFAGVHLVHLLRSQGNFDFVLKLAYVLVLGFIGTTMLVESLKAMRGRTASAEPGASRLTLFFARLPFQVHFPKSGLHTSVLVPVSAGFLVGVLAALLGVGGGFIMLPAMIYIIGIPTRVAVGTDLFQIVLTSGNVALQQAITNHTVDILLAVMLFLGSTIGAQFGVLASKRLRGEQIRVFLAVIVVIVMGILLVQLLMPPSQLIAFAKSGGGH